MMAGTQSNRKSSPGADEQADGAVAPKRPSQGMASSETDGIVRKRRRKAIKSCAFCRKRKLRCDQKKPICSTCIGRGFTDCVYSSGFEYEPENEPEVVRARAELDAKLAEIAAGNMLDNPTTRSSLLQKLDELQKQLEENGTIEADDGVGPDSVPSNGYASNVDRAPSADAEKSTKSSMKRPTVHRQSAILNTTTNYISLGHADSTTCTSGNIMRDYFTLQCKGTGRRIMYGPTSTRIFLAKGQWGLLEKFRQVWVKVKAARVKWKNDSHFTMLREMTAVEEPFDSFEDSAGGTSFNLKNAVCSVLPTYEEIQAKINFFFSNNVLFQISDILDESKVQRDFVAGFIPGGPSPLLNGRRPIIDIVPSAKKNYYRIGVISMILAITHYQLDLPMELEKFFIYLSGLTTAKTLFIERPQVAVLRYHYRLRFGFSGGDGSHAMLLVDESISTATYLGLNHNINLLYKDQEYVVGKLKSLENLWLWILFADCEIAIQIGRPSRVHDDEINDPDFLNDNSQTFYGLLKRFLVMVRGMISELYNQKKTPKLTIFCETLIQFVETEFPPLCEFTGVRPITYVDMRKTRILSQSLSLLIIFYCLRYSACKELGIGLKNGVIKSTLIAFSLYVNITLYAFELDKKEFPEQLGPEFKYLTPYLSQSVDILHGLAIRSIIVFYSIAYNSLTLFESGLLCVMKQKQTTQCDLNSLRVQDQTFISFLTYFRHFLQTFDTLMGPVNYQFTSVARKNSVFVIGTAFERVCRTVIEKVMECRSNAENNWITESQNQLPNLGVPKVESTLKQSSSLQDDITLNLDNLDATKTEDIPNFCVEGEQGNIISQSEQEEIAQTISDEFWQNYNISWQEILDNAECDNFLEDLMM